MDQKIKEIIRPLKIYQSYVQKLGKILLSNKLFLLKSFHVQLVIKMKIDSLHEKTQTNYYKSTDLQDSKPDGLVQLKDVQQLHTKILKQNKNYLQFVLKVKIELPDLLIVKNYFYGQIKKQLKIKIVQKKKYKIMKMTKMIVIKMKLLIMMKMKFPKIKAI